MTEGNINQPETTAANAEKAKRDARRRLIKAALFAAPLIVTLRGKPAHAQLSSLGSIDTPDGPIPYGPGMYVDENDIKSVDNGGKGYDPSWLGQPKNANGDILKDATRRSGQTDIVSDPKQPKQ